MPAAALRPPRRCCFKVDAAVAAASSRAASAAGASNSGRGPSRWRRVVNAASAALFLSATVNAKPLLPDSTHTEGRHVVERYSFGLTIKRPRADAPAQLPPIATDGEPLARKSTGVNKALLPSVSGPSANLQAYITDAELGVDNPQTPWNDAFHIQPSLYSASWLPPPPASYGDALSRQRRLLHGEEGRQRRRIIKVRIAYTVHGCVCHSAFHRSITTRSSAKTSETWLTCECTVLAPQFVQIALQALQSRCAAFASTAAGTLDAITQLPADQPVSSFAEHMALCISLTTHQSNTVDKVSGNQRRFWFALYACLVPSLVWFCCFSATGGSGREQIDVHQRRPAIQRSIIVPLIWWTFTVVRSPRADEALLAPAPDPPLS